MPEIWEHPFGNALLKIERANKHIADIERRVLSSPDTYGPRLNMDGKTGEQFLSYSLTDRNLRRDIALIVGDAVHNLHCALDISYRETMRIVSPPGFDPSRTKFPVGNNQKHLESSLTETAKVAVGSPLFVFLVERVKSYVGGDADICALHRLDIDDKHHLLIPMLTVMGVNGVQLEDENGAVSNVAIALTRPNYYRMTVPLGTKLKNHGHATFRITFSEGDMLKDAEVIPTLQRFSAKSLKIVRIFQRIATRRWP